jgi:hypothetical protein
MKGGNTDSKAGEVQGYDTGDFALYDMNGGKKGNRGKKSPKFDEFDFEKEWKEFETSYNQKYGGASKKKTSSSTKKKPAKKASSSTKKKPTKKASSRKRLLRRSPSVKLREVVMNPEQLSPLRKCLMKKQL